MAERRPAARAAGRRPSAAPGVGDPSPRIPHARRPRTLVLLVVLLLVPATELLGPGGEDDVPGVRWPAGARGPPGAATGLPVPGPRGPAPGTDSARPVDPAGIEE
jgi:hypothetical protein